MLNGIWVEEKYKELLLSEILTIPLFKEDMSLTNFKNITFNMKIPKLMSDSIKSEVINKHVNDQIIYDLNKSILKLIPDNQDKSESIFIENINKDIDSSVLYEIYSLVKINSPKYLMTNIQIGSILRNSDNLYKMPKHSSSRGTPYEIGEIYPTKVLIDPSMSYNDNRLIMINDHIGLNFKGFSKVRTDDIYPDNNIKIKFDIAIKEPDFKTIYIITSKNSEEYLKFKGHNRNITINKILDN